MNEIDQIVIRGALKIAKAAGDTGLLKKDILAQCDVVRGEPMANNEQEELFQMLLDRGWITSYVEPIWHNRRYRITTRGMTALEGM